MSLIQLKRTLSLPLIAFALLALTGLSGAQAGEAGTQAPDFKLQDQNGDWHALEDYQGQWLVLFFYPKDDTPGCTTEACNFRDDIFKFRKLGVTLLGVSLDDVESHKQFADKYELPFSLLFDDAKQTIRDYGVDGPLGLFKMASRQTFLISPDGLIARRYAKVDPEVHSTQVLDDLKSLIGGASDS